jgi:molybdopterin synthase sulfur carrier subunit
MKLELRYFAGLRELLDCSGEAVEVPAEVVTVAQLRQWLSARGGAWMALTTQKNLRAALDQRMLVPGSEAKTALRHGAEVAFFPPVTGG